MNDLRLNSLTSVQGFSGNTRPASVSDEKSSAAESAAVDMSMRTEFKQPEYTGTAKTTPDAKQLRKMAEEMQQRVGGANSQIQFSVDESTGISVVKVTDRTTKEVIRQIPSEEMLEIAKGLDRYKEGLLVNSQA